eukprot:765231-Hanusia_phi.AAC.7
MEQEGIVRGVSSIGVCVDRSHGFSLLPEAHERHGEAGDARDLDAGGARRERELLLSARGGREDAVALSEEEESVVEGCQGCRQILLG